MFTGLVSKLLAKYLGDYVEGFNTKNLNISVLSGKISLKKLKLKREAFEAVNLPIQLVHGHIGSINIDLSWRKLKSKPVVVTVEDVFLVVRARRSDEACDEKQAQERLLKDKADNLESWEMFRFPDESDDDDSRDSVVSRVVDNLQVVVKRVHLRFEGKLGERPYSAGFTIQELSMLATDSLWRRRTEFPKTPERVFRSVLIREFALYLNVGSSRELKGTVSPSGNADIALMAKYFEDEDPTRWHHLIPPSSIEAQITQEKRDEAEVAKLPEAPPMLNAVLYMDQLGMTLERLQYQAVVSLASSLSGTEVKTSQEEVAATIEERDTYVRLYKHKFYGYEKLTDTQKKTLKSLEEKLPFTTVLRFRGWAIAVAAAELKVAKSAVDLHKNKGSGILSVFRSSNRTERTLDRAELEELYDREGNQVSERTDDLPVHYVKARFTFNLDETFVTLLSATRAPWLEYRVRSLAASVAQRVNSFVARAGVSSVELVRRDSTNTQFPRLLSCSRVARSWANASTFEHKTQGQPIFSAEFSKNPLNHPDGADVAISVKLGRVQLVYDAAVFAALAKYFHLPAKGDMAVDRHALSREAYKAYATIRERGVAELAQVWEERPRQALDVELAAPTIIIPQDSSSPTKPILIANLGDFHLYSVLAPESVQRAAVEELGALAIGSTDLCEEQIDVFLKSSVTAMRSPIFAARGTTPSAARGGSASSETPTSARRVTSDGAWSQKGGNWNVFYDHFVLHGEAISLFISTGGAKWEAPPHVHDGSYVIRPFGVTVQLHTCIVDKLHDSALSSLPLPSIRVNACLEEIDVALSSIKYRKLMSLVETVKKQSTPAKSRQPNRRKHSRRSSGGSTGQAVQPSSERKGTKEDPHKVALFASFLVGSFRLSFVQDLRRRTRRRRREAPFPVLSVDLAMLGATARQRTFDTQLELSLVDLRIKDLIHTARFGEQSPSRYLLVASAEESDEKVSAQRTNNVLNVTPETPSRRTASNAFGLGTDVQQDPLEVSERKFFSLVVQQMAKKSPMYKKQRMTLDVKVEVGSVLLSPNRDSLPHIATYFMRDFLPPPKDEALSTPQTISSTMGRYPIDKAIAEVDEADDNESIHSLGNESFTSLGSWDDAHEEEYKSGDDHKGHSPSGSDDDDDDDEEAEENKWQTLLRRTTDAVASLEEPSLEEQKKTKEFRTFEDFQRRFGTLRAFVKLGSVEMRLDVQARPTIGLAAKHFSLEFCKFADTQTVELHLGEITAHDVSGANPIALIETSSSVASDEKTVTDRQAGKGGSKGDLQDLIVVRFGASTVTPDPIDIRKQDPYDLDWDTVYPSSTTPPSTVLFAVLQGLRFTLLQRPLKDLAAFPRPLLATLGQLDLEQRARASQSRHTSATTTPRGSSRTPRFGFQRSLQEKIERQRRKQEERKQFLFTPFQFKQITLSASALEVRVPAASSSTEYMLLSLSGIELGNALLSKDERLSVMSDAPPDDVLRVPVSAGAASKGSSHGVVFESTSLRAFQRINQYPSSIASSLTEDEDEFHDAVEYRPFVFQQYSLGIKALTGVTHVIRSHNKKTEDTEACRFLHVPHVTLVAGQKVSKPPSKDPMKQAVAEREDDTSDWVIDAAVDGANVMLSHYQFRFLRHVLDGNLKETSHVPAPFRQHRILPRYKLRRLASRASSTVVTPHTGNSRRRSLAHQRSKDSARGAKTAAAAAALQNTGGTTAPAEDAVMAVLARVVAPNLCVVILEHPFDDNSNGLVLTWTFISKVEREQTGALSAHMEVRNTRAVRAQLNTSLQGSQLTEMIDRMAAEDSDAYIIAPFDTRISAEQAPSYLLSNAAAAVRSQALGQPPMELIVNRPIATRGVVRVGDVNIRFTYDTYVLLRTCLAELSTSEEADATSAVGHQGAQRASKWAGRRAVDPSPPTTLALEDQKGAGLGAPTISVSPPSATAASSNSSSSPSTQPRHPGLWMAPSLPAASPGSEVEMDPAWRMGLGPEDTSPNDARRKSVPRLLDYPHAHELDNLRPDDSPRGYTPRSSQLSNRRSSILSIHAEEDIVLEEETKSVTSFGEQDIELDIGLVYINLVNDVGGVNLPIAQFRVDEVAGCLFALGHQRTLNVALALSADYYNDALVQWEPVLEPWSAKLAVYSVIHSRRQAVSTGLDDLLDIEEEEEVDNVLTTVSLVSDEKLNFNVSRAMMDGMQNSLDLLSAYDAATSSSEKEQNSQQPKREDPDGAGAGVGADADAGADLHVHEQKHELTEVADDVKVAESAELDEHVEMQHQHFSSYIFRNQTELPVSYVTLAGKSSCGPYCDVPLEFSTKRDSPQMETGMEEHSLPDDRSLVMGGANQTSVTILLRGYQPIQNVKVEKVATHVHYLRPEDSSSQLRPVAVVCEVLIEKGLKILSVHSTIRVENVTPGAMQMFGCTVRSGQEWFIPLSHVYDDELRVRPRVRDSLLHKHRLVPSQTQYQPSDPIPLQAKDAVDMLVSCQLGEDAGTAEDETLHPDSAHNDKLRAWHLCVEIAMAEEDAFSTVFAPKGTLSAAEERDEHKVLDGVLLKSIFLRPPVHVENFLSVPVLVSVTQRRTGNVPSIESRFMGAPILTLGVGDGVNVDCVNVSDPCFMSFRVPGLKTDWTHFEPLSDRHNASKEKLKLQNEVREMVCRDDRGRELTIHMEIMEVDDDGLGGGVRPKKVVLFVPYWIYDLTGLSLVISEDCQSIVAGSPAQVDENGDISYTSSTRYYQSGLRSSSRSKRPPIALRAADMYHVPDHHDEADDPPAGGSDDDVHEQNASKSETLVAPLMFSFAAQNPSWSVSQPRSFTVEEKAAKNIKCKAYVRSLTSGWRRHIPSRPQAAEEESDDEDWNGSEDDHASSWSRGFGLDAIGTSGALTLESPHGELYEVSVHIYGASNQFRRTKWIVFKPRIIIVNNFDVPVQVCQRGQTQPQQLVALSPGGMIPFHWPNKDEPRYLAFRLLPGQRPRRGSDVLDGLNDPDDSRVLASAYGTPDGRSPLFWAGSSWSGYFDVENIGDLGVLVRGDAQTSASAVSMLASVDVRAKGSASFVVLEPGNPAAPPFRIENRSACELLRYGQRDVNKWDTLAPYMATTYAWDEPLLPGQLSVSSTRSELGSFTVSQTEYNWEIGKLQDHGQMELFDSDNNVYFLSAFSIAEGPTTVLIVSDFPSPYSGNALSGAQVINSLWKRMTGKKRRAAPAGSHQDILAHRYMQITNQLDELKARLDAQEERLAILQVATNHETEAEAQANEKTPLTPNSRGAVRVDKSVGRLVVRVVEACRLPGLKVTGSSDPYAMVTFGGQQSKTPVLKGTINPYWDHDIVFDCPPPQPPDRKGVSDRHNFPRLKLALFHHNWVFRDDFLGGVVLPGYRLHRSVYPTVAKWRVESKRKQRQMQRAAVEPQDDEPIEQDNSTSGFGDLIDVPVNDQWFSLEWPRQFDREQGSVRLRIQWVPSEQALIEDKIKRLNEALDDKARVLDAMQDFYDRPELHVPLPYVAPAGLAPDRQQRVCSALVVQVPTSPAAVRVDAVTGRTDLDSNDERTEQRILIVLKDASIQLGSAISSAVESIRRGFGSISGGGRILCVVQCKGHSALTTLYEAADPNDQDASADAGMVCVVGDIAPAFNFYVSPEEITTVSVHFHFYYQHNPPGYIAYSATSQRKMSGSGPHFPVLRSVDSDAYFYLGHLSVPLQDVPLVDSTGSVLFEPHLASGRDNASGSDAKVMDSDLLDGTSRSEHPHVGDDAASVQSHSSSDSQNGELTEAQREALQRRVEEQTSGSWHEIDRNTGSSGDETLVLSEGRVLLTMKRVWALPLKEQPTTKATVKVPLIGASVIDAKPQELFYVSVSEISADYEESRLKAVSNVYVENIQVDNQLQDATYPVVLAQTPVPVEERKPLLQLTYTQRKKAPGYPVKVFSYASAELQNLELKVEEDLIYTALALVNEFAAKGLGLQTTRTTFGLPSEVDGNGSSALGVITMDADDLYSVPPSTGSKLFFTVLQIDVVGADLYFRAQPQVRSRYSQLNFNPMSVLLNLAGATFGSIDGAPVRLDPLTIENAYGCMSSLYAPIKQHYKTQALGEVYKILGSIDVLGNPVKLLGNLGTGVKDFLTEPVRGLRSSPTDFGVGLAKGTTSLLRNTAKGIFGAGVNITQSAGTGLAMLSLDAQYIAERRAASRRNQPKNVVSGLAAGVKSLGAGVVGGLAGLVVDPVLGARDAGLGGFVKGFGKGVAGVLAKPAVGVVDLASHTLQGLKGTVDMFDQDLTTSPVRLARYIGPDGRVTVYDVDQARGQHIVRTSPLTDRRISSSKLKLEAYLFHIKFLLKGHTGLLVASSLRIIFTAKHVEHADVPLEKKEPAKKKKTKNTATRRPEETVVVPEEKANADVADDFQVLLMDLLAVQQDGGYVIFKAQAPPSSGLQGLVAGSTRSSLTYRIPVGSEANARATEQRVLSLLGRVFVFQAVLYNSKGAPGRSKVVDITARVVQLLETLQARRAPSSAPLIVPNSRSMEFYKRLVQPVQAKPMQRERPSPGRKARVVVQYQKGTTVSKAAFVVGDEWVFY